jgi:hypothetical protein
MAARIRRRLALGAVPQRQPQSGGTRQATRGEPCPFSPHASEAQEALYYSNLKPMLVPSMRSPLPFPPHGQPDSVRGYDMSRCIVSAIILYTDVWLCNRNRNRTENESPCQLARLPFALALALALVLPLHQFVEQ